MLHAAFRSEPQVDLELRPRARNDRHAASAERVRRGRCPPLVVASTTMVYGPRADNPNFLTEDHPLRGHPDAHNVQNRVEAEQLVAAWRARHPAVEVSVLRPCWIAGPSYEDAVTRYFSRGVVPTLLGYDPLAAGRARGRLPPRLRDCAPRGASGHVQRRRPRRRAALDVAPHRRQAAASDPGAAPLPRRQLPVAGADGGPAGGVSSTTCASSSWPTARAASRPSASPSTRPSRPGCPSSLPAACGAIGRATVTGPGPEPSEPRRHPRARPRRTPPRAPRAPRGGGCCGLRARFERATSSTCSTGSVGSPTASGCRSARSRSTSSGSTRPPSIASRPLLSFLASAGGGSRSRARAGCRARARALRGQSLGAAALGRARCSRTGSKSATHGDRPRFLVADWLITLPFAQPTLARLGGVRACRENAAAPAAQRSLGHRVSGRCEGRHQAVRGSLPRAALRARRRGAGRARGGRAARPGLRRRAPRRHTRFSFKVETLARSVGLPFVPVTPTFPWLGPLGLLPLPVEVADPFRRADRRRRARPRRRARRDPDLAHQ